MPSLMMMTVTVSEREKKRLKIASKRKGCMPECYYYEVAIVVPKQIFFISDDGPHLDLTETYLEAVRHRDRQETVAKNEQTC